MTRREVLKKWDRRKREILAAAPDDEKEWFKQLFDNCEPPPDTKDAEQWMDGMEKFIRGKDLDGLKRRLVFGGFTKRDRMRFPKKRTG